MILRAFLFAFARDHDVIDDGIAGLQHTSKFRFVRKFSKFFNLPELSRMFSQIAIFYAVNHPESIPKLDGYTPDSSYAEKLAGCEKDAEELRQLITSREQGNPNAALL